MREWRGAMLLDLKTEECLNEGMWAASRNSFQENKQGGGESIKNQRILL